MNLITWAIDFYKNNEKLAIALVSLIGGVLLTQIFPKILYLISKTLEAIGQKMGGIFSYRVFEGRYLNWVILQNQELNLTGMIGTGQKPMLEEVFISLKISDRFDHSEDKNQETKDNVPFFWRGNFEKLTNNMRKYISSTRKIIPSSKPQSLSLFQPRFLWNIQAVFERDYFYIATYWIVTIPFVILPALYLLQQSIPHQNLATFFSSLSLTEGRT